MSRVNVYLTSAQDIYVRRLAQEAGGQPSDIIRGLVGAHMHQVKHARRKRPLSASQAALRVQLVQALHHHGGNVSEVARALGEHRRTIQRRIQRLQIRQDDWVRGCETPPSHRPRASRQRP